METKKRSRLRIALFAGSVVAAMVVTLVALGPWLLSSDMGRSIVQEQIGRAVNGSVQLQAVSLSWLGEQRVQGLSISDSGKQTNIQVDAVCSNALVDLLLGSVNEVKVKVSGSVNAQILADGTTSLSSVLAANSATKKEFPSPSRAPAAPSHASSGSGIDLPFPVRIEIGSFDATLTNASGTAFALRDLKGSASLGRGRPLEISLAARTQLGDQSGDFKVNGTLDNFLTMSGDLDLAGVTGTMNASVSGWLLPIPGVNAHVQTASLSVQATKEKPIDVSSNAMISLDQAVTQFKLQMLAARPQSGQSLFDWAIDPRTWIGSISVEGFPTEAMQRFAAGTGLRLSRDCGPTVSLALQTGEGSVVNLSVQSKQIQLTAIAELDTKTGAMKGRDMSLQIALDPALLEEFGTSVREPLHVSATVNSFQSPAIGEGGTVDMSAISFDGSLTVQPFQVFALAELPVVVGESTMRAKAVPLGGHLELSLNSTLQQSPIAVDAAVDSLGASLDGRHAKIQATVAAGPLDPAMLPLLPAAAKEWIAALLPGATTVQASLSGGFEQGTAQARVHMVPGVVELKSSWTNDAVSVDEISSEFTLQPAAVEFIAKKRIAAASPIQFKVRAGPVRVARNSLLQGTAFDGFPVVLKVPVVNLASAPGVVGAVGAKDVQVNGAFDPDGPTLFDGTISVASATAIHAPGVGPIRLEAMSAQAKIPIAIQEAASIQVSLGGAQCGAIPGIPTAINFRNGKVSLQGPLSFGAGTQASVTGLVQDASATLATISAAFEPADDGWKASMRASDVDMHRILVAVGNRQELPEWVGKGVNRSVAINANGNAGGISFGMNASLDPIAVQVKGTRAASGALTISQGEVQAQLPASVVQALLNHPKLGVSIESCDALKFSANVKTCTLVADEHGTLKPLAAGSNLVMTARVEPWKLRPAGAPALSFGANEMSVSSKAGEATTASLTGSLAAEGMPPSPLNVSLETSSLLDKMGNFSLGAGTVKATVAMKDFPTALVDRATGMDGYLVDMLGPVFTVNISGKSGLAAGDFFKGSFSSPTISVQVPKARLSNGVLSVSPDAPITASLSPDDRFRARILRPINPFLADLRTTNGRPIQAAIAAARIAIPVDMAELDASFSIDVGDVEMEKSGQFVGLLDIASASKDKTIPGLVSPLHSVIARGILTYKDFKVQVGRLGKNAWQQTLMSDARINLAHMPPMAEPISIRYPASSITNTLAGIPGMGAVLGKLNKVLGKSNDVIQNAVQVKVDFTGPLDGTPLKVAVSPEFELPKGMGGNAVEAIQRGIGGALDDLFGKKK